MVVGTGRVDASVVVGVRHRRERERRRSRTHVVGEGERGRRQAVRSPLRSSARRVAPSHRRCNAMLSSSLHIARSGMLRACS